MANQLVLLEAHLDGKPCAPRSLVTLNWRDLISSSSTWEDTNYKRTAIASLIQAVYLLEQDRQENRTQENAQAPNFWIPFKYKLTQTLIDERDGSIFGAIFEWDRSAALADLSPFRPSGAPRAVLALRGTLLRSPTMRRDIEDDLRFVAWKSLKGSARFNATMDVLKSICSTHGSSNVCIAGHSLGAGFSLQVGQELAKERINVEAHLFNPPAVSLAVRLENIGEMAEYVWNIVKSMLPSGSEAQASNDDKTFCMKLTRLIARLSGLMDECFRTSKCKWVPHLYVNTNDWISFFYIHTDGGTREKITEMRNRGPTDEQNAAKLFVVHKENQKFLEAHGLKQWWSSDAELQQDIRSCKVMSRQLRSLNTGTLSQVILFYYPHSISLAMSVINIRQMTGFVWNVLQSVPPYSISLAMSVINVRQMIDFVWNALRSVPHLTISAKAHISCMNDAVYWVCKWVPYLHVGKNDRTGDTMKKFFVVSKEQQKFLAAHGLEQWWPSEKELLAIHNSQLRSRQVSSLYTTSWEVTEILYPSSGALAMCFSNIGEREEFVRKWNSLKLMLHSSSEAQSVPPYSISLAMSVINVRQMIDFVWNALRSVPHLTISAKAHISCMNDAVYWVCKWVPYLHVGKNDRTGDTMKKFFVVSKEQQKFLAAHGLEQWWPSEKELLAIHNSQLRSRQVSSLYTTSWEVTEILYPSSGALAMCFSNIGEREEFVWKWNSLKSMLHSSSEAQSVPPYSISLAMSVINVRQMIDFVWNALRSVPHLTISAKAHISCMNDAVYWVCKWVPYLHVGKNDRTGDTMKKFFVVSKEQQKFLAAHGLEQWWPSEKELLAIHSSQLISRQVSSLYTTSWEVTEILNPSSGALAMSFSNIGEREEFVWKWNSLKSMLHSSSEAQSVPPYSISLAMSVINVRQMIDFVWNVLRSVPHLTISAKAHLSCMNDAVYWVCKWVPYLHAGKNDRTGDTMKKFFVASKEQQKFLAAHGLEQWWPSEKELLAIHNSQLISRQVSSLYTTSWEVTEILNPSSGALAMSFSNIGEREEFVWKWNNLESMLHSSSEAQSVPPYSISLAMSAINVRQMIYFVWNVLRSVPRLTISAKAHLSCMNDAVYWVCKWVPYLHVGKNDRTGDTMKKFFVVSKEQQKFLAAHGLEQWWPSEKELLAIHNSQLISRQVSSLYTTSWEVMEILNPSSGALSVSFSNIGEREEFVWKWNSLKSMLHSSSEAQVRNDGDNTFGVGFKGWMPQLSSMKDAAYWVYKRVPYLYVSKNGGAGEKMLEKENTGPPNGLITAKLFVVSKEKQKFLAAHGLEQWWPSVHNNQLMSRIFRSVYPTTPWEITQLLNPSSVSLATSLSSIREREEFVCKWNNLLFVPHLSGKAQVIDDGCITSGVGLRSWIPQLSGLKDAAYWVCKWVPNPFVRKNDGAGETMIEKENIGPTNGEITANLFVVSKEQQKFLAAHGLKQWWPSDAELQQAIHNRKITSRQFKSSYIITPWEVTEVLNPSSGALSMSFSKIGEREEFVWKWNSLRSMLPSSLEAHVSSVGDQTSGLSMKSFMHSFSGLKDAGFAAGKWVPHMYSNCSDYMSWQFGSMYSLTHSQISQLFNLPHVLPSMSLGSTREKAKFVCNNRLASMCSPSSEAQASNDSDNTSGVSLKSWMPHFSGLKDAFFGMGKFVPYLYANKSDGRGENMDP